MKNRREIISYSTHVPVSWGINDGDVVVLGLELPQSNIDGDTTFTLSLQLVQNPGILEGALAHLKEAKSADFSHTNIATVIEPD